METVAYSQSSPTWVDLLKSPVLPAQPEDVSANKALDPEPIEVLEQILRDPSVTDILINPDGLWVDNPSGLRRLRLQFLTESGRKNLARLLAFKAGVRLDASCPVCDGMVHLAERQVRLHAVIYPVAVAGTLISLRVVATRGLDWQALCERGMVSEGASRRIEAAVSNRQNLLFSGGTGSGKTTLLGAILGLVPTNQRIICVEQVQELCSSHPHLVRLQERSANVSGAGEVSLSQLISAAMRMRPDRIVLGECRGAEVAAVLAALNTGHQGSAATIHANSAAAVPARLLALGALAGLEPEVLGLQAGAAFDLIIHLERAQSGNSSGIRARQVSSISRISWGSDGLQVVPEWSL